MKVTPGISNSKYTNLSQSQEISRSTKSSEKVINPFNRTRSYDLPKEMNIKHMISNFEKSDHQKVKEKSVVDLTHIPSGITQKTIRRLSGSLETPLKNEGMLWRHNSLFCISNVGIQKLSAVLSEKPVVPANAISKLNHWLNSKPDSFFTEFGRVAYSKDQIPLAMNAFYTECNCSWKQMKKKWQLNLEFMQIINDLRGMYIDELVHKLKQEFHELVVEDFGSNKLTSDRDLSFKTPKLDEEIYAVELYNQLFAETQWRASASHVFDNNAYTRFYIESLKNEEIRNEQLIKQNVMSLVMFLRYANHEKWRGLEKNVNSSGAVSEAMKKIFVVAESEAYKLQILYNAEIIQRGIKNEDLTTDIVFNQLELVGQIERVNPELSIAVDYQLHDNLKKSVTRIIKQRKKLHFYSKKINAVKFDAKKFYEVHEKAFMLVFEFVNFQIQGFNSQLELFQAEAQRIGEINPKYTKYLGEESQKIKRRLDRLKNIKDVLNIPAGIDLKEFKANVQLWIQSKEELYNLKQQLIDLNHLPLKIYLQKQERVRLKKLLKNGDSKKLQNELAMNHAEMINLKNKLEKRGENRLIIINDINKINYKIALLPQKYVFIPEIILKMYDEMQLAVESNSMKAQCFAQEAHVTPGAYGFVVEDIQGGKANTRNIGEYMQAVNELMGFFYAHQKKSSTTHDKLIEVSKYVGTRLTEAYKRIEVQAKALKIDFPDLYYLNNITGFFSELFTMREGKIHPNTLIWGLESHLEKDLIFLKDQLLNCKSKKELRKVLVKNRISLSKMALLDRYFPLSDKGGILDEQKKALVEEIGKKYNIPSKKNGGISLVELNAKMNEMHAKVLTWATNLTIEQQLMLGES